MTEIEHLLRNGWAFVATMDGDHVKFGWIEADPIVDALNEKEGDEDRWGACIVSAVPGPNADFSGLRSQMVADTAQICVQAFCSGDEDRNA